MSDEIHPLVRALFLLRTDVDFLLDRSGVGQWKSGNDIDVRIASFCFKGGFSWCCGAPFARKPDRGTEEFCSKCDRHLGHYHARGGKS